MSVEQRPDGKWQGFVNPNTNLDPFELREHAEIELMVYTEYWNRANLSMDGEDQATREKRLQLRDRTAIWESIVKIMKERGMVV